MASGTGQRGLDRAYTVSVVIPAHNESSVIERALRALDDDRIEVVVACNGCTDDTADRARRMGAVVVETPIASKARALQLGDDAAHAWPRAYVDADMEISAEAVHAIAGAMEAAGVEAGSLGLRVDDSASSALVRAYYRGWLRLPQIREGLAGRGIYVLSQAGRARFEEWPDVLGDDYFVDRLFGHDNRVIVSEHASTIEVARSVRQLVARNARVHRGNAEVASSTGLRHSSGFLASIGRDPRKIPDALVYAALTVAAKAKAKFGGRRWARGRETGAA